MQDNPFSTPCNLLDRKLHPRDSLPIMHARLPVYTIPLEVSFVDALAAHVLEQTAAAREPWMDMLILLPTRRACRALQEAFLRITHGKPVLLPRIRPIGDVDADELLLSSMGTDQAWRDALLSLPPAMSESKRLMLLARIIHEMSSPQGRSMNMGQALQLAAELARFRDEMAVEDVDFHTFKNIVPQELAQHWQVTLDFLSEFFVQWPAYLKQHDQMEPVERRSALLGLLAEEWTAHPPSFPVIAAGSTGSSPTTSALLKVISRLPRGQVILPGLLTDMDNDSWKMMDETHPQFGLKRLLTTLGCARRDVRTLGMKEIGSARTELIHEMMRPALASSAWKHFVPSQEALKGISLAVCKNVGQEAKTVALVLRETLDSPGKTAALVTHDRPLAKAVSAEMQRFGVRLDDSAGTPLRDVPEAVFLRLIIEVITHKFAPVPVLSLLLHPMSACSMAPEICRSLARMLEKTALRGIRPTSGLEGLLHAAKNAPSLTPLLASLQSAFLPWEEHMNAKEISFKSLLLSHITSAEELAASATNSGAERLWKSDTGRELRNAMEEILESADSLEGIDPASYSDAWNTLVAQKSWRPSYGTHPRLHILSPLEARMQHFDRMILGGINEENWPPPLASDAWMSRPMRAQSGLPPPEKAIGQAAHDFMMLLGGKEILLTRAEKKEGTPTIPSRWIQRLQAIAGQLTQWQHSAYAQWATMLDKGETTPPLEPPAPTPPLAARPRTLSVTRIEMLMRNPYAVYASHVLKLRPLEPVDRIPTRADFGILVHAAMELFRTRYPHGIPANDAYLELMQCADDAFKQWINRPAVAAYWMPRFARVASWIIAQEKARASHIATLYAEVNGTWSFHAPGGTFTLTARIDRLEKHKDGGLTLIDYKTGAVPSMKEIDTGYASQLPLTAVIAQEGKIEKLTAHTIIHELEYWKLGASEEAGSITALGKTPEALQKLMEDAKQGVIFLMATFDNPNHPYLCHPHTEFSPRYDDYAHLARLHEWQD